MTVPTNGAGLVKIAREVIKKDNYLVKEMKALQKSGNDN